MGKFEPKRVGLQLLLEGEKGQKRTASSNPLRSTNESVRTAGPFCAGLSPLFDESSQPLSQSFQRAALSRRRSTREPRSGRN